MAFDSKEDLQRICESVITYQNGLAEINKYIGQLNDQIAKLGERGACSETEDCSMLDKVAAKLNHFNKLQSELIVSNDGVIAQLKQLRQFSSTVKKFEDSAAILNQSVDLLNQMLVNDDDDFEGKLKQLDHVFHTVEKIEEYTGSFSQKTDLLNQMLLRNNDDFAEKSQQLQELEGIVGQFENATGTFNQKMDLLNHLLVKNGDSLTAQMQHLEMFNYTLQKFEKITHQLNEQTDDFGKMINNEELLYAISEVSAVKGMEQKANGGNNCGGYTVEDLLYDYKQVLENDTNDSAKRHIDMMLTNIIMLLKDISLRRSGQEAMERLIGKLISSKSEVLEQFVKGISDDKVK